MSALRIFVGMVFLAGMIGSVAFGYDSTLATYTWNSSTPGYNASATLHLGTIDTSSIMFADFLGRSSGVPNAGFYGDSGVSVGWDDTWVGSVGNANTNGDGLDGLWVQIYSDGGWWDLGAASSTVAVFTSQDHGGYLGEGLEYRVFATNTLWDSSPSGVGNLTDVYLDGWRTHNSAEDANRNGWLSDDISGVFDLGGSYRYVKVVAWATSGGFSEPEIDAVGAVVPLPAAAWIGLVMLGGMGIVSRRRRRQDSV